MELFKRSMVVAAAVAAGTTLAACQMWGERDETGAGGASETATQPAPAGSPSGTESDKSRTPGSGGSGSSGGSGGSY